LKNGVLTLRLELVPANWYPAQDGGRSFPVYAFAEKGKAPQIPGPLVRVPQGAEVRLELHNTLATAMFVRGFQTPEPVSVAPGGTAEVHFTAKAPGTFYYSARSCKHSITEVGALDLADDLPMGENPFETESQLEGALIVDPPGAPVDDRIFFITTWMSGVVAPPFREVVAINGKSWPYTERLAYRTGDSARWRLINASMSDHAMHLHGFHFAVNSVGDQDREKDYPTDQPLHAVTQHLAPGQTAAITWVPTRVGRWLFHCHMTGHMSSEADPVLPLTQPDAHSSGHEMSPESMGMMGMILGVTVSPGTIAAAQPTSETKARQIKLFVRERPATRFSLERMGYVIEEGDKAGTDGEKAKEKDSAAPLPLPGAPLVLTRGELTEITVVNELKDPTAVHWHGIEIESYYDGVPGWGGNAPQFTPPIPPGGSFVAHMTPPRAGTFIYHTHWHDAAQLTSGLYGPIIVMEPGQKFDPEVDKIFLISRQSLDNAPSTLQLLNGEAQPAQMSLKRGVKYRLRFINIGTNDADLVVSILGGNSQPIEWKPVSKDGWTLSSALAAPRPAIQPITVGETYDFEFQPESTGDFTLQVKGRFSKITIAQAIKVK
jgi:FtsP/CotA-like multicopper oxidase with cupredoxin domain